MNIYIGNLSHDVTEGDLRTAFSEFGQVSTATVIKDKFTNEHRGFGFVEMPVKTEAENAIRGLNGNELKGKNVTVNEARPKTENRGFGGGGGGRDRRSGGGGSSSGGGGGRRGG
ncbi:MAG: RNA-binding protein, partial [Ignavibacteriales bacterium]|nr:RNA-binding protein [Ignavibacteriales bacterium]